MFIKKIKVVFFIICVAAALQCKGKNSNAIIPEGKIKIVTASDGLRLRKEPNVSSLIVTSIPKDQQIFIEQSIDKTETLNGATGQWFKISWQEKNGYAFGGFLKDPAPETSYINLSDKTLKSDFKAGCLGPDYAGCESCDAIRFAPDGKFEALMGCHYGEGRGKWTIKDQNIFADFIYFPSCYDSCPGADINNFEEYDKIAKKYSEENSVKNICVFELQKSGTFQLKSNKKECTFFPEAKVLGYMMLWKEPKKKE